MNILAITVPHSSRHTGDFSLASFPLGMAYILASVRQRIPNANIRILDLRLMNNVYEANDILYELKKISKDFKPDFILYGGMISVYSYLKTLSQLLADVFPQASQVLGGAAPTTGYKYFKDMIALDYIIVGEGEHAIIDLLTGSWKNNKNIGQPGNLVELKKQVIDDINMLPFPSYQDFNIKRYVENNYRNTGWKFMNMITSRGCPFACDFCSPNFGRAVRIRNEDLVIEEMLYLKTTFNLDSMYFWDEIQFIDKPWMERFCNKLVEKRVSLKWVFVSRASLFNDNDVTLLKLMNKAGCIRISLGIESGNQQILDRMNKKVTVGQIEHALRLIRGAGIKATGSMLLGYPGENKKTIQDSIDFANRNLLKTSFYNLIPMPSTEIFNYCRQNNYISNEIEYIEHVSSLGGDASINAINLTDLDNETYVREIRRANNCVSRIKIGDVLNYYGYKNGTIKYAKSLLAGIGAKMRGRRFETP
jgi:anaerobic magnesium-protoporphyrin IX monomethyl ester cyclase